MNRERLGQIQLPAAEDFDPHPRLLLNGRGIHAGETFHALFPDGWREITIEMSWEPEGPGCWYISTPGFTHICPIGLFVKESAETQHLQKTLRINTIYCVSYLTQAISCGTMPL